MDAELANPIRLSACLIVRDSARTLRACLESIRPWVDEMVVVDTGSLDETISIAKELGARVSTFEWCDDFSAARNESLRHARGDWLLWIDSDDTIDATNGQKLRALADQDYDPSLLGLVMQVHCPGPDDTHHEDVTLVDHVKMFRNRPDLRFEGRIHEQILPAIRRAGGQTSWTDIFVVHSGYDHSPAGQERKRERDLRLLHKELSEQPGHPFTLFNLGMTYTNIDRFEEAAEYLSQSIRNSQQGESHLRKAFALLVYDYRMLHKTDLAWAICQEALQMFPLDVELHFRSGVLLQEMGRYAEAAQAYERAINSREEPHFSSYDRGIRGFKARQNLALTFANMENHAAAEVQWRNVVREQPAYRSGWRGLGENLIKQQKLQTALALSDRLNADAALALEGHLLRARVLEVQGDIEHARRELELAEAVNSADHEALIRLCRLVFEHCARAEAEAPLQRLLAVEPQDAAAHHNLGSVNLQLGRIDAALRCYRESLKWRPNSAETHVYLGYALEHQGSIDQAIASWEDALRLAPGDQAALQSIERVRNSRNATTSS